MSLILNPRTGHTSLQYHVKHDEFFEMVHPGKMTNFDSLEPEWKYLAHLLVNNKTPKLRSQIGLRAMFPSQNDNLLLLLSSNKMANLTILTQDLQGNQPVDEGIPETTDLVDHQEPLTSTRNKKGHQI